jgi:hypothetical protein
MRRAAPAIAISFSVCFAVILGAAFVGAYSLLPRLRTLPVANSDSPDPSSAVKFSLAPPSFLLRLSLFPEGQKHRSLLGVMIENSEEARPYQEGLDRALFVQEFFVEGFISRFLVLFDRKDLPPSIGPVRSLRPYFVDASQPWVGAIVHAGGSPEAFERAAAFSALQTINVLHFDDEQHPLRRDDVPPPHNLFLSQAAMQEFVPAETADVSWPPYPTGGLPVSASGASVIRINFLSSLHDVEYNMQPSGAYRRLNGGVVSPLQPQNILLLEMPITEVGELGRLTIPVEGRGDLLLFRSGYVIPGTWRKDAENKGLTFLDAAGRELVFAAGSTWMTVVPEMWRVTWE